MRLTIIPSDNLVLVDGRALEVDLSTFSALLLGLHAVQWDGTKGHEEHVDLSPNTPITNIDKYQPIVAAWTAEANKIDAAAASKQTFDTTFDMGRTMSQILTQQ